LYFDNITHELGAGHPVNYARLLAEARKELRASNPEFDAPFHRASFVLIGPAQSRAHNREPQG
jgi:CHAT domain-containing protein